MIKSPIPIGLHGDARFVTHGHNFIGHSRVQVDDFGVLHFQDQQIVIVFDLLEDRRPHHGVAEDEEGQANMREDDFEYLKAQILAISERRLRKKMIPSIACSSS